MTDPRTIPVVVLNWNGWSDTERCLASLAAAGDYAVWLVDNGSREDRTAALAARFPRIRPLRFETNRGYAGGINGALRVAAAEGHPYAYLLNNDCEVTPAFLEPTLAVAEDTARIGAVGSVVVYADDPTSVQYDGTGHPQGAVPHAARTGHWPAGYAHGAGMLVSLAAAKEVGFLDERFFCYHEEIEWCHRLRRGGWAIRVAGESVVRHHCHGSDTGGNGRYYRIRNEFLLEQCLGKDPRETARRLLYQGAVLASREPSAELRQCIAEGLWDGLAGRFGPRPAVRPPGALLRLCLAWWTLRARLHDKRRALRGLQPGWQ